jgi:hypothetical protein
LRCHTRHLLRTVQGNLPRGSRRDDHGLRHYRTRRPGHEGEGI